MRQLFSLRPALSVLTIGLLAASVTHANAAPQLVDPYPGYTSANYANQANWLCRPDKDDVCDHELDATSISVKGKTKPVRSKPARRPKFDCFYVYPTISTDGTGNSDFVPGADQELFVVNQQAARLNEVCRVFAPVYRQITLTALISLLGGNPVAIDPELAYGDVVDAWKHYVANDSEGRGVLLIGHSQGASVLTRLLQEEIDPNPDLRARLVSAMLLGTSFQVPEGADVGGSLANIPLCRARDQSGCIITYSSFRSTAPPPSNSRFGRSTQPGWKAACTNPADLDGGSATLHPFLPTSGRALPILPVPTDIPWVDPSKDVTITTPYVTLPRFLTGTCAERDGFSYLEITVHGDPGDLRIDDIGGDLTPDWGLHLVDANVAMGDLVTLAKRQGSSWRSRKR